MPLFRYEPFDIAGCLWGQVWLKIKFLIQILKSRDATIKFGTIFTYFACKMSQNVLPNTYAVAVAVEAAKTSLRLN